MMSQIKCFLEVYSKSLGPMSLDFCLSSEAAVSYDNIIRQTLAFIFDEKTFFMKFRFRLLTVLKVLINKTPLSFCFHRTLAAFF